MKKNPQVHLQELVIRGDVGCVREGWVAGCKGILCIFKTDHLKIYPFEREKKLCVLHTPTPQTVGTGRWEGSQWRDPIERTVFHPPNQILTSQLFVPNAWALMMTFSSFVHFPLRHKCSNVTTQKWITFDTASSFAPSGGIIPLECKMRHPKTRFLLIYGCPNFQHNLFD